MTGNTGSALLQAALRRENLLQVFKCVRANKGAARVDGRDIDETSRYLAVAWSEIREQLLAGTYRPSPVRRVMIPKPGGGERELGIPTVMDRLIQQALLQVLQPILAPTFSEHSYGFRPGRRAQDAVLAARAYVQNGRRIVVDVDLAQFFDRVNHDILIDRLRKRIDHAGVNRLVRAYLNSGIMDHGVVQSRHEGTPQGGPLSPLLGPASYTGRPMPIHSGESRIAHLLSLPHLQRRPGHFPPGFPTRSAQMYYWNCHYQNDMF
ncbi:MAG: ltrA [Pseudoduganella sp.]|jgi:RNA-directed DNA polymerase|nr:ltrA [Pseudoduganella sp.]